MKRQRQTRPSRFSNQFQGKESSLGPPEKESPLYEGINFRQFKMPMLTKYMQVYGLTTRNTKCRDECAIQVKRHWNRLVLDENEVLFNLGQACRKNANASAANGR